MATTFQTTQLQIPEGMIDLGAGQPSPALLPLVALLRAAEYRLGFGDASLLQYGANQGDGYLRHELAKFLSKGYRVPVEADHLFITNGVSQGLDFICQRFTQPGDTIFVEEPTYFLALRIFADHGLRMVAVPTDGDGLIVEALEEKLAEQRPKFLYTIPTYHNPRGINLSAERRQRLVALSQAHDFLIVADEVYHLLAYIWPPPPPLASHVDTGKVLSLGSFSKILAPGLRLGWIQAAPPLLEPLLSSGYLESGGGLNPFTSGVVYSVLAMGLLGGHLARLQREYGTRLETLSRALRRHLPDSATFTEPDGGFFIWLRLPPGLDAEALLAEAGRHQVGFQPGPRFSSRQALRNYVRLSFSYYDPGELEEGARRLGRAIAAALPGGGAAG